MHEGNQPIIGEKSGHMDAKKDITPYLEEEYACKIWSVKNHS